MAPKEPSAPGLRQTMSWLHTWCGLVCGWLLCAIFLTGTISVFREPITRWMEAVPVTHEGTHRLAPAERWQALRVAQAHLAQHAPDGSVWRVSVPFSGADPLQVFSRTAEGDRQVTLDPVTGETVAGVQHRSTEGGRHFMSFHYSLQGGMAGFWVVGLVSMCMMVALVSGVIVHRRIFQDFFTFRPGKGQRSWLDAHNASAVLTLPFLFMIVYTGLAHFYTSYMPWPMESVYGQDKAAYSRYQAELNASSSTLPADDKGAVDGLDLVGLVQHAQQWLLEPVAGVLVRRPEKGAVIVHVTARRPDTGESRSMLNSAESVVLDATTGRVVQAPHRDAARSAASKVHPVISALHLVTYGGWAAKWLYFICGLIGTAMVATGLLLFSIKRRTRSGQEWGAATPQMYRCIDALNVAALAGTALASVGYLYGNRLLPPSLEARSTWEIRVFFALWAFSLLHALLRTPQQAWREQLWAVALLCLALPWLNLATTGQHLGQYLAQGDGQRTGVELTCVAIGLLVGWGARRHAQSGRKTARTTRHVSSGGTP
ncbi:MAG: PepSY domain-containing protein [Comamonas sp.]|nr:PepSY domain-containing protein [Comamonas sp.]